MWCRAHDEGLALTIPPPWPALVSTRMPNLAVNEVLERAYLEPYLGTEALMFDLFQWLRQPVSRHILRGHMLNPKTAIFDSIDNPFVAQIDVLCTGRSEG